MFIWWDIQQTQINSMDMIQKAYLKWLPSFLLSIFSPSFSTDIMYLNGGRSSRNSGRMQKLEGGETKDGEDEWLRIRIILESS